TDLHFQHDKAEDVLERTEQVRLAEMRKYPAVTGLLPVEQFMREYFQHTSEVREIASHVATRGQRQRIVRALWEWIFSHRFDGDFRVGWSTIAVERSSLPKLKTDLA